MFRIYHTDTLVAAPRTYATFEQALSAVHDTNVLYGASVWAVAGTNTPIGCTDKRTAEESFQKDRIEQLYWLNHLGVQQ